VRINAFGSGLEADDLDATLPGQPDTIVLPKANGAESIQWLDRQLALAEQANGWPASSIGLIALIETALGVVNLKEICSASPRLSALIFGAEDLAGDLGVPRTLEATEVFYARSAMVIHAAAFGLQAIDMVSVDFRDLPRLEREAAEGARLGYAGKQAIHPDQVEPIQAAFTPSAEAIAHAKHIVEAARAHQAQGTGAFALDNRMVDAPVVKSAQAVLAKARAAGLVE
jgi:citrate lyase beta subunit